MYGHTHVRHSQLRLDRPVGKLHGTVHDRLWVYHHLYLSRLDAEQPFGLYHFKTLVHHRRGVDGDFRPHRPVRMFQRLGFGHRSQLFMGKRAERTARSRQDNLLYRTYLACQTLEDSRMFRIHRNDVRMIIICQTVNQFPGYDQRFLIGQCNGFSRLNRTDGRP